MNRLLVLFAIPALLLTSGCIKLEIALNGKTTMLRDDLQLVCRGNDALVLASSYFVSNGKIYYLKETNGAWGVAQIIDLAPHLNGWHTLHLSDVDKERLDYNSNWISYNDHWLAITTRKVSDGHLSRSLKDYRGRVIIFKKVDGTWKHYYTLKSGEIFIYAQCVAVTDFDQLIVSDPFKKTETTLGVVRCFDLKGEKPRLVQEIYPPKDNIAGSGPNSRRFGNFFSASGDRLMINVVYEELACVQFDLMLYQFTDGEWKYSCSFLDKVPQDIFDARDRAPLNNLNSVDFEEDGVTIHKPGFSIRFKSTNGAYAYEQSCFDNLTPLEELLPAQTLTNYSLAWLGKRDQFGLTKPSADGVIRFAEPDWIVEDADPETNRLVSDYYRYDFNTRYAAAHGYKSFYDFTKYVPSVDYALCGETLITSYFFPDCYFTGNPMQKADVWGGVNIYKIDPTTGPKKVFALTTRNLEELKPVPVTEEEKTE